MSYIKFSDDKSYLDWIVNHPDGFVLNMRANESPNYMVLHKATCFSIKEYNRNSGAKDGGFTQHDYRKVYADTVEDLKAWVRRNGHSDGSFSKECGHCKPT